LLSFGRDDGGLCDKARSVASTRARLSTRSTDQAAAVAAPIGPAPADQDYATGASPARVLQEALAAHLAETAAEQTWSPRSAALFTLLTCGGFWAAAAWAAASLLRR
jgi:hypothetical protein